MREEIVSELRSIVGEDWVITGEDRIQGYLYDETPPPMLPEASKDVAVVKPRNAEEVSEILKLANRYGLPVFPRGGGTGLVGACVPTMSGIILSLERMNIIKVDRENLMAEAEAGATLADLLKAAEDVGLFFPPHPGDEGAHIGGLLACNAGGARAVKTGVIRNYVKGVEVVLPTGEILTLGGKLVKNNAGYDLMHLIIGSEGTLGVITKAWIRLYPREAVNATIVIPFEDREMALKTVPAIFQEGLMPLAIEYVEKSLVEKTAQHLGLTWPCRDGDHQLILILAEASEAALYEACEKIVNICEKMGSLEPLVAESRGEQERILKIRSEIYSFLKPNLVDILDTTVPPAQLLELIKAVEELGRKYNTYLPVFGHVGDGNLHIHLMREDGWTKEDYDRLRDEVYRKAIELGGTITGEHGIGYIRRRSLEKYIDKKALELMRAIKRIFDPNNILNPDKVFP
ncbi:MAG: FAD-binding oxidoreductase [Nitrososphaeria archaeon]|nr:FAD-binding oxidoreductase [Aigarchaeota archaeon]MCX8187101.1 FAD-binding oxidoreductase [Nitrososphaeria archaeon]MDW8021438.1 FAD-binding oxidoreductase [Nitrososphaerota archaeon]